MKTFGVIADILAIVGFCLACFIAFQIFPNSTATSFDYQAVLVGIISGIFALLVGWNIYQMVDWKNKEQQVSNLQNKLTENITYIHNKTDYNQALMYAIMSQTITAELVPETQMTLKFQMLLKGIQALKIFSNFPDCDKEINSLMKTLIIGLENSRSVQLSDDARVKLLMKCGEINNKENIESFDMFIKLVEKA